MNKEIIKHSSTSEQYTKITLDSGLTVLCYPVEGYTIAHAVYGTSFGSVDKFFSVDGISYEVPAGVAHFLEHKMFENEDGQDAFELYAKTGASANAFTSFDKTCYIFTASDYIDESLDILLSFVSKPYFTKETVEKEQGIIGQEIKMYDDNPDWRLLFALLDGLYHSATIKDDIAGTVESISKITPDILYTCTNAFYNPHNMVLSVAGNITEEQLMAACERAGLTKSTKKPLVERVMPEEPSTIHIKSNEFEMTVSQPILGIAFKEVPLTKEERMKSEIVADMLTELIVGDITPLYRKLYDEGLINPGFEGDILSGEGYFSIQFTGETSAPEKVEEYLLQEIRRLQQEGIEETAFVACKNTLYGEAITELENMISIATNVAAMHLKGYQYYGELDALATVTLQDVNDACKKWFDEEKMVRVVINPKGE